MSTARTRPAAHAGSWYTSDPSELRSQLTTWLAAAAPSTPPPAAARIIITPHAGFSYSGPSAAHAYANLALTPKTSRIFILGPSHHLYLSSLALSTYTHYATPLGSLQLDTETLKQLHSLGDFQWMQPHTDSAEHSIEMQLPFLHHLLATQDLLEKVKIVPIMVGGISARKEKMYGEKLAPWLRDPENVFVVSSDFCHWGVRFSYTHFYTPELPVAGGQEFPRSVSLGRGDEETVRVAGHEVWESVEALDRVGMRVVEGGSHEEWAEYCRITGNTVCGRHPIGVVMAGVETVVGVGRVREGRGKVRWVWYEQSSKVRGIQDSSVSYGSGVAVLEGEE